MYKIIIISKNKLSIKLFSIFLKNANKKSNIIAVCSKKKTKKVITVLKSPHVNKTAQEQFEFKFFYRQFLIRPLIKNFKFLLLIKKIKSYLFSDTKIIIKFLNNHNVKKKYKLLNPNNFKLKHKFMFIKKTINIFDIYGELLLK